MASHIVPIKPENFRAINGMPNEQLFQVREHYIFQLVGAHRRNDTDSVVVCLDWLSPLLAEMCLRGEADASDVIIKPEEMVV